MILLLKVTLVCPTMDIWPDYPHSTKTRQSSFSSLSNTVLSFTLNHGRKKERREAGRWMCWKSPIRWSSPNPHSKDEQTGETESDLRLEILVSWHLVRIFVKAVTQCAEKWHKVGRGPGWKAGPLLQHALHNVWSFICGFTCVMSVFAGSAPWNQGWPRSLLHHWHWTQRIHAEGIH